MQFKIQEYINQSSKW